ncbi:MAG: serine protease, partial [Methylomonas sp.]
MIFRKQNRTISSDSPFHSVVSVWSANQWIGSAFSISPSLLLTARHVVRDEKNCTLFPDLSLHLMSGIENLTLLPDLIYCHPELDVALIELEVPYDDQFCCKLDLDKYNFQGKIIDYFGINSRNTNRDLSENITVGILDQAKQGYMFHDRVKKGFSGGPVSLHKQNKVLGVISQR